MGKSKIEWCDFTWNPVVGCPRGCSYCYAKRMNDRFKFIPDFTKPQFFESRMGYPEKIRKPANIFVGSMSDCAYWSAPIIDKILNICASCSHHTFMFLSKNVPFWYFLINIPENCLLGLTITDTENDNAKRDIAALSTLRNKTFLSVEPLLGPITFDIPEEISLVIVGAMTGPKKVIPEKSWIQSIFDHCSDDKIFLKNNIREYL